MSTQIFLLGKNQYPPAINKVNIIHFIFNEKGCSSNKPPAI